MSKNLRNIVKKVLRESDFDWAKNYIEVGNCFKTTPSTGHYPDWVFEITDFGWKQTDPKTHEPPKEINSKNIVVEFGIPQEDWLHSYAGLNRLISFSLPYHEVEQWIDRGWLMPTECE